MNEFESRLQQVFVNNVGNKLTEELANGMYAAILDAHKKAIEAQEETKD